MKCQSPFSVKNKKNNSKCCLQKFLFSMLMSQGEKIVQLYRGSNLGPLDYSSDALLTELC